jgi:hypothetical protein
MGRQAESKLSQNIQKMIRSRGGYCYKVWANALTPAGIPDIVCCYYGLFLGFETKTPLGQLSKIQVQTHKKMSESGAFIFVPRSVQDASDALDEVDEFRCSWVNTEDEPE